MLLYSTVVLAGCGSQEQYAATLDSSAAVETVSDSVAPAGPVAYAPITGRVREVKMMGDGIGYRFEPAVIRAKPGDGVRFIIHSFGPHNVVFDSTAIPAGQRAQLHANMRVAEDLGSPMLFDEAEAWELSLGRLKPGRYRFICSPHLGANMTGEIIIE